MPQPDGPRSTTKRPCAAWGTLRLMFSTATTRPLPLPAVPKPFDTPAISSAGAATPCSIRYPSLHPQYENHRALARRSSQSVQTEMTPMRRTPANTWSERCSRPAMLIR